MTTLVSHNGSRPGTPSQAVSKAPIPTYEKTLYEKFHTMYNTLLSLKNNRSKYINSKQVYQIYDEFLNLLHDLKLTRKDEELKGMTLNLPNHNDLLIDDIWQLVSLCFVTCGLIKFAPATYSSLSTVFKFLHHLRECQVYTLEDLEPIKTRLSEIRDIVIKGENEVADRDINMHTNDPDSDEESNIHKIEENLILRNKLNRCQVLYSELEDNFRNVPEDLESIYNQLILIRKSILNYLTNNKEPTGPGQDSSTENNQRFILAKINQFKLELKEIESTRDSDDGKFHSRGLQDDDKKQNAIQIVLNGLLDDCNNLLNDLSIQNDSTNLTTLFESSLSFDENDEFKVINKGFETLYNKLIDLKYTLENLLITRRWTLRETDLYTYQKLLKEVDDERIGLNNRIRTSQGSQVPASEANLNKHFRKNQILILYLLRRCYSLIYKLLESSEPVSESLQPIHNQLSTVRKCLLEIKRIDGLNNLRELYPFQFKLASLDNLRSDGKFIINNQIPEGQGTLNALLAECFDIIHELKIELEEKEDEGVAGGGSNGGNFTNSKVSGKGVEKDDDDIKSDDEVEIKRNRYVGFHEADYDQDSESGFEDEEDYSFSDSEYEGNDYY